MKKFLSRKIDWLWLTALCLMAASVPAAASTSLGVAYLLTPRRVILFVVSLGILVVALVLKHKRGGGGSSFMGNSFMMHTPTKNDPFSDSSLSEKEIDRLAFMYQAGQKTGQKAVEKEGKVMVKCPNCGAPVRFAEIMECDYCKTQITRKSVADQLTHQDHGNERFHKDPPVTEFNPNRYYDENITGYDRHDEINGEQEVRNYYDDYR